ncbi:MAG TPA: Wzz/FepE/Etk N-terminal domain-containing protein [Syntrophorhabdaceae bacterium]|jgi:uncharacterized protein involved in exopolysaccharide biosynthesis
MEIERAKQDTEISIFEYLKIIINNYRLILAIVIGFVALTIVYASFQTPVYEARAVIEPIGKTTERSGIGAIAQQFGLSTPASTNMAEIVNILRSNILKEDIIKKYNLVPIFLGPDKKARLSEEKKLSSAIMGLAGSLKIVPSPKDNAIELTMQFRDPKTAADILGYTMAELTDRMSREARRVANTNKAYIETQIDKTADPFIRTKLYSMIAQQIEIAMMAEVKENFAFKVIDPPKASDQKVKPKKRQMVMIAFIIALFVAVFTAFVKEFLKNNWRSLKELMKKD